MSSQPVQLAETTMSANQQKVLEVLSRLDQQLTAPEWKPSGKPVDELVATILSQNTSDVNTDRSFRALRKAYPSWSDVVDAPVEDIVEKISAGGLARQKAPRIQKVLREVLDYASGDPNHSLNERLQAMSTEEAIFWLTGFPGVGPKTTACVLLFAVGKPVVPVDTHVYRVSKRIGLISERTDANGAHGELLEIVPPDDAYRFHVLLIRHGRTTCKARSPRCSECVLLEICDYGSINVELTA